MNSSSNRHPIRHAVDGTIWVFIAEALILPTGLITTVFLTARLGASGYGAFTLAATIIGWVEWTIASVFARPAIKFIGEADDWHPVGSAVVRQFLWANVVGMLLVWALAWPAGMLLHEPTMPKYLCLFAIDIPIFGLAQAHRNILIGLSEFRRRAWTGASRWVARLIFILIFVQMGWSIDGAIVASILASCVELAFGRAFVRPSFKVHPTPVPSFWGYATPLLVSVLSLRLYEKLDLFLLKGLGGTTADAGIYGAAQNLAIIPGIFAMSFTPLLLATVSRMQREAGPETARRVVRHAMRLVVLSLCIAAVGSGSARDVVALIYRPEYAPAAGILAALLIGAWGMVVVSAASAILIAYARPNVVLALTLPLMPIALGGHWILIPLFHAPGAAWVTGGTGVLCAIGFVLACWRVCGAGPGVGTAVRTAVISSLAFWCATAWPVSAAMVAPKILLLCAAVVVAIPLTGEISRSDWAMLASFLPKRFAAQPRTEVA